jgi:hypothetical protein
VPLQTCTKQRFITLRFTQVQYVLTYVQFVHLLLIFRFCYKYSKAYNSKNIRFDCSPQSLDRGGAAASYSVVAIATVILTTTFIRRASSESAHPEQSGNIISSIRIWGSCEHGNESVCSMGLVMQIVIIVEGMTCNWKYLQATGCCYARCK